MMPKLTHDDHLAEDATRQLPIIFGILIFQIDSTQLDFG